MDGDEDYVLSVHLRDKDGQKTIELAETIVNVSGDQQSAHSNETAVRSALSGCLVSSSHRVKDLSDEQMTIFFFPDLKVWIAGRFSLYFKLFYMPKKDSPHLPPTECLAGVASDKFTVYTLKEFPGVYESTPLSKHLTAQGLCISIRNKSRLKVSDDDNGATMEADHLDKNHDP
ncbi:hypothetical protein IWW37_004724 [Coemansia sp. RSA 2050]|nr:hypothetical protein IWW37_004724 [Coemansia sp. RSA 2050]KAJ2733735.1 hypothetical protein IW152_002840 [Coemansia sp. BCRC 34962]